MLRSMTGYGSAQGQVDGVEYAVELRSVNNRYFKLSMRLPEIFSSAEGEMEKLLRGRIQRGSLTLTVRMKVSDEQAVYRVNSAALSGYIDQLKLLEIDANPILRIDLGSLLQLPGVCQPPPLEEIAQKTRAGLMDMVAKALDGLLKMRKEEGKALEADLLAYYDIIEQRLSSVARRAPQVVVGYHQRLAARVAELTQAAQIRIDEDQLAREVAIFAERCDIAEEISRLAAHIQHAGQAIAGTDLAGRKLDFIAQEMLREANTIASKANDVEIARAVVDIKTAIDRIKEQVQNAE